MEKQPIPTKVVTGLVRFSFANVFTPTSIGGGEPKYNISILIPKSDKVTLDKINAAIEAAKEAGKDKLVGKNGKFPANLKLPLRDGDVEKEDNEVYAGHFFLNANSFRKPQIVGPDPKVELTSPEEFYSGCYGRASVNFYAFDANGNKGIACGLSNLQKLEDGENLSGGATAEEDFSDELA